jgi:F0F1-type ATP synthase membrane subunit b/b'
VEHVEFVSGVILPFVNFTLFAVLAFVLLRKPLNAMAYKRYETYKVSLDDAQRAHDEAMARLRQVETQMADIQTDLGSIRDRTRELANREATDMIADANQLADHLRDEAHKMASAEVALARVALRREIVADVRMEIESRLKAGIDPVVGKQLIQRRLTEMKSMKLGD